jgi:signal transduction histidine kinase
VSGSAINNPADDAFRQAVKDALIDALCEQKDLFHEVFSDVLEDFALAAAIREGCETKAVSRSDVFEVLEK